MSVIVLTSNGYFWEETSCLKRVLNWLFKDKVEVLRYDENKTYTSAGDFGREGTVIKVKIPLVVRLLEFSGCRVKSELIEYSSDAVYNRDNNVCQYLHEYTIDENGNTVSCEPFKYRCTEDERSIDHVVPVSRGGKTNFLNCITCCKRCNILIKGNSLPKEAGLKLIRQPFVPVRKIGELWLPKFIYNPNKASHKAFYEVMGLTFNHKV